MRNLVARLRRWFALERATGRARSADNPEALVAVLQRHPEVADALAARALWEHDRGAVWPALLYAAALVQVGAAPALEVLRKFLAYVPGERPTHLYPPAPWHRLSARQVQAFLRYLTERGSLDDAEHFVHALREKAVEATRPHPTEMAYLPWVAAALARGLATGFDAQPLLRLAGPTAGRPGQPSAAWARQFVERGLAGACQIIRKPKPDGQFPVALRVLSALWPMYRPPLEGPVLACLADRLPALADDGDVVRAADLLRRHPSAAWVGPLRRTWLALDDRVRRAFHEAADEAVRIDRGLSSHLEMGSAAVLAALGACAACDPHPRSFAQDEQVSQGLLAAIDQYNRLVEYHNGLVSLYRSRAAGADGHLTSVDRDLSAAIRGARDEIAARSRTIDQLRLHRGRHSAGLLLWSVLRETQAYPTGVRQGAAWGLHFLCRAGHLEAATRERVWGALRDAVQGDDNRDFRERRVQLLPGQGLGELAAAIQDGLQWVADLAEGDYHQAPAHPDQGAPMAGAAAPAACERRAAEDVPPLEDLEQTLGLLCERMPEALRFLTHYPLRLMLLEDHRHVLGMYIQDGCSLSLWTHYTGAHFSGPVHQRSLCLVDRSTPNAMGIYHRLFRHPLLLLPVLYHEHLHYGGPDGDPEQGIQNEAEVLVREIVFARGLIAWLAERGPNEDLAAFEQKLVRHAQDLGVQGLLFGWLCDFDSDEELERLNAEIRAAYGDRLSDVEAERRVQDYFLEQNIEIQLANDTNAAYWCPEVRWPLLNGPGTEALCLEFRRILLRRWQCRHHVTRADVQRILRGPACQAACRAWASYCRRVRACRELQTARVAMNLPPAEWARFVVRNVAFEPQAHEAPLRVRALLLDRRVEEWLRQYEHLTGPRLGYVNPSRAGVGLAPQHGLELMIRDALDQFRALATLAHQHAEGELAGELEVRCEEIEHRLKAFRLRATFL
jgi:hypothetical protein